MPTNFRVSASDVEAACFELVHHGHRHQLYRSSGPGRRFIVKRTAAPRPDLKAIAALRHEYEILCRLCLPGIVKAREMAHLGDDVVLILEDAGSSSLAERLEAGPLEIIEFLEMSLQLAETVARMHAAQVVHRNINPTNVVWDPDRRMTTIVDFAMATILPSLSFESARLFELEGAQSYISPEQTGRIGRAVDARTDLYSLGATFYELLTGAPPFVARDSIELLHAHLARRPRPPHEVNERVPAALSSIVLKLLEKEPQRRYQTAGGLAFDLREAQGQWARTGAVRSFALGRHDPPRVIRIPDRLYGRAVQTRMLEDAFARAAGGEKELVLVTGDPGVGKSVLINQIEPAVANGGGALIVGKFDQLQRGIPYSGLLDAFRMLIRRIIAEPEPALVLWRERIQAAVAPNGRILTEAIAELDIVIGPQPQLAELGPLEAKNRFDATVTSFLRVFARPEHPLAIFLDDLQWIDAASLELIGQWVRDSHVRHLLLLGAYRDGEVDASHPFALWVKDLREQGNSIRDINLGHLACEDIGQLIADTLEEPPENVRPLAELVLRKTAGNPFFVKRLLHTLHAERLIAFVAQTCKWHWDLGEIESAPASANVLELMLRSIGRLPERTRSLLEAGACIGHRFELGALSQVMEISRAAAINCLWPALEDGLLLPIGETHQAPRQSSPMDGRLDEFPAALRFVHDKVQQAAYSLLTEDQKQRLHLSIGRCLLAGGAAESPGERLFEIVDQLSLGEAMITDSGEHRCLAELGLAAGYKAKVSGAYQAAFDYLCLAVRHLSPCAWETDADLAFALHRDLAESAYLTGRHDEAERLTELAIERAPSRVAKMELYSLRATAACASGDNLGGLRAGRAGLALFGLEWPLEGLASAAEAETEAVMRNLAGRRIDALAQDPEPTDEGIRACIRLLSVLGPPAYFSAPDILPFIVARLANLSIVHGPSEYSAYGYTFYGGLQNRRTGDYETGYAFGRLALALARRFENRGEESRTAQVFGLIVNPWKAPLRTSMPLLREGCQAGLESGELLYVALTLCAILITALPLGIPLAELEADVEASLEFSDRHHNRTNRELTLPYRQIVRCLTGRTAGPSSFEDGEFNESRYLEDDAKDNLTAIGFYWINRLQAAYLAGDYQTARMSAAEAAKSLSSVAGMIREAEYMFFKALTFAALCRGALGQERSAMLAEIRACHDRLATWAEHCPENFRRKEQLVAAELAGLMGEPWRAVKLYRAALEGAGREHCTPDEALAAERLACFLIEDGDIPAADAYFRLARDDYRKWGATLKVGLLEAAHPRLFAIEAAAGLPTEPDLSLDTFGFIKASQAICAETGPEKLVERVLPVIMQVAGAKSGTLFMASSGSGNLMACGRATADVTVEASLIHVPLAQCRELPQALVRYVARIKDSLVLSDAGSEGPFASDPVVRGLRLRSVLCIPLKRQAELLGILYLENRALAGAFTPQRVEIVQALAAQAVVSLERSAFIQEKTRLLGELQAADRRKNEFLAMLAHELRNPLAPIRHGVQVMRLAGSAGEAAESVSEMMERQVGHLVRLVDDLLDVSRVSSGKMELRSQRIELMSAVQQAVEAAQPLFDEKQVRLEVALPGRPLDVNGDPARLVQAVGNLLNNACKFTPKDGHVEIEVKREDAYAVVRVQDTGIGIAAEHLPHIFDMFVQVDSSIERSTGGLGLGLTLVKQVIAMHGGTVEAHSRGHGQGSEFVIRLPIVAESAEQRRSSTSAGEEAGSISGRRILVVDDNRDAASSLAMVLELSGNETRAAFDGASAIEMAEALRPDLILLDIGMPGLNGYEVARRIRGEPWGKDIVLIALSGWGQEEDRRRSIQAGFSAHLVKPVSLPALMRLPEISVPNQI